MSEQLVRTQNGFALQVIERQPPDSGEIHEAQQWAERISDARDFDKVARKNYAIDRRYARGDSGKFEVDVPIAGAYADILTSYLYARDPDLDAVPARAVEPPPEELVSEKVKAQVQAQISAEAQQVLASAQGNPGELQQANAELQQKKQMLIKQGIERELAPYRERQQQAKQFGETLAEVIKHLWSEGKLRNQALPMIRSGLTVSTGWIKVTWQEQTKRNPMVEDQVAQLMTRLNAIAREAKEGDEDSVEEIKLQVKALMGQMDEVDTRGLAIDFVPAENIQVSEDAPSVAAYTEGSWIAERIFMPFEVAQDVFSDLGSRLDSAVRYGRKKPVDMSEERDTGLLGDITAEDADAFEPKGEGAKFGSVLVWEIWDRADGVVRTLIDGVQGWAVEPYVPDPQTRRFYPYFQFAPITVDGERHAQSLVQRSRRLLDEYNRCRSAFAEHRRRAIPKLAFDATNMDEVEAKKLAAGIRGEMVPVKPLRPGTPVNQMVVPVAYNQVDMGLYDTSPIRAELEMVWGIQQALASSIQTAKTATEAEIQQQGTQTRLGYMQFNRDVTFQELAEYSAEIALAKLTQQDVAAVAGPWAIWPQVASYEELVKVKIQAGSSGRPNTSMQQKTWMELLPILREAIMQVAQYRESTPDQIADAIEAVVEETLTRFGEHIDAETFLPQASGGQGVPQGYTPSGPPKTKVVETIPVNQPGQSA